MLIKIVDVCDSTLINGFNHDKNLCRKSKFLLHNPYHKNSVVFNSKDKQGNFQPLRSRTRLHHYGNNRRKVIVYSVEPGASPSGPPTNILSWIAGVAIAIVIPLISYKWGPSLKSKVEAALQTAEDVAEAVEEVAEKVEKAAEDIVDDLPEGGKLREAIDFVEKIAERAADDAGAIDDFIDKVQEQEEKAESLVKSLNEEFEKPPEDPKEDEKSNVGN